MREPDTSSNDEHRARFDQQRAVAVIETDRFCDDCGYNLRTQPVRHEPHTKLLLVRCPECGRFLAAREQTSVGSIWGRRLAPILIAGWIIVLLAVPVTLATVQVAIGIETLDELTTHRRVYATTTISDTVTLKNVVRFQAVPRDDFALHAWLLSLACAGAFATGFAMLLWTVVTMPHWRRWGYVAFALLATAVTASLHLLYVFDTLEGLVPWSLLRIGGLALSFVGGALLAAYLGRAFARLACSVMLPPRLRTVVAYLWLIDGKTPSAARPHT